MPGEVEWVSSFIPQLSESLKATTGNDDLRVEAGRRLRYTNEVLAYTGDKPHRSSSAGYQTDVLISDIAADQTWTPRVIVECKLASITTHDALTYSAKAATHKHVHPYLRYGILIGQREHYPLPGRLIRHGAYFDFMASWTGTSPLDREWNLLVDVLADEVRASRVLEKILTESRSGNRDRYVMLHRPLKVQ